MTPYEKLLAEYAPELHPTHVETLARLYSPTLNGQPREFFAAVAVLARKLGPEKLERLHRSEIH